MKTAVSGIIMRIDLSTFGGGINRFRTNAKSFSSVIVACLGELQKTRAKGLLS
mgnify:CR=1 FL=1